MVNAQPMAGLLTGIARYLRNLYGAMARFNEIDIGYFNGHAAMDTMPPLSHAGRWQSTAAAARHIPEPVVFALRVAQRMKYEHALRQAAACPVNGSTLYHETAFSPAKMDTIPTVFSIYDLSLRRYRKTHPKERVWMFEYFIKRRLNHADHILTISEFIRREIMDEFNLPGNRVTAVPLAPDHQFGPCDSREVAAVKLKYGLPESYLLFVSSLEPRKNIDLLIQALAIAKTDIPLVLVGWQGWGEKQWLDHIRGGALKNRIHVTGHMPDTDLKAVYNGARALVYPSIYEGFGLPIVEAMACKCPVICSNVASMPEVAGDAALLIDPTREDDLADALDRLVQDSQLNAELKEKGAQRAAQFTWERTARHTLDLFKSVAG